MQAEWRQADEVLRRRLPGVGVTVVPNSASGQADLALISSMLQSAGVPLQDVEMQALQVHAEMQALQVHAELTGRHDALGLALRAGRGLHADPCLFLVLAVRIFGEGKVPPVLMMMAGAHGAPLLYAPSGDAGAAVDPAAVSHDTAVFMESPGQFEAVANTSGQPWSMVLAQLHMAPDKPQAARDAAWLQHNLQAVRALDIRTHDGEPALMQTHRWSRGVQTRLLPQNPDGNLDPLMQARAMSGAQKLVDDFWAALETGISQTLGRPRPAAVHQAFPGDPGVGRRLRIWVPRTASGSGAQVHQEDLALDAGGYHAGLAKDRQDTQRMPALQGDQTAAPPYIGELTVRQGVVVGLTVQSAGTSDIVVEYDRLPRQDNESLPTWAQRMCQTDQRLQALGREQRIALMHAITTLTPHDLSRLPALRDVPAALAQQAQGIAQGRAKGDRETKPQWAQRLYQDDANVRALPYEKRLNLLATITGIRECRLRDLPALWDMSPELAQQKQALTQRLPRRAEEPKMEWVQRICETDKDVQAMGCDERITLLAVLIDKRPSELRRLPALQGVTGPLAAQARAIAEQMPRETPGESKLDWAYRIYQSKAEVRALPELQRILLLCLATWTARGDLRRHFKAKPITHQ